MKLDMNKLVEEVLRDMEAEKLEPMQPIEKDPRDVEIGWALPDNWRDEFQPGEPDRPDMEME